MLRILLRSLLALCALAALAAPGAAAVASIEVAVGLPAPAPRAVPAAELADAAAAFHGDAQSLIAEASASSEPATAAARALLAPLASAQLGAPPTTLRALAPTAPFFPEPALASADDAAPARPPSAAGVPSAEVAVGGLALVWLAFEKLGLARALVALYFRVQPSELLEHERRERVIALVRERPGIGPTEIAEELGTGWGVTSYHLDRLERAGLVSSQRMGHHRCYFLPGAVPRDQQRSVGMFRVETTRRIAELVTRSPGIAQSQLCQELGLSASAASKQLSRLEAASLVRREAGQGGLRVFPQPTLAAAL